MARTRVCIEKVEKKIELVRKKIGCLAIQNSAMQYDVTCAYSPGYILRCKLRSDRVKF